MSGVRALDAVKPENADQRTWVEIVREAIQVPARQIVDNAGRDGAVVGVKLLEATDYAHGCDAQTGVSGDLYKKGISTRPRSFAHDQRAWYCAEVMLY